MKKSVHTIGHDIPDNILTIAGWAFMISVGFNAAISVRVSNELGAGNPKSAAFSVKTSQHAVSDLCPFLAVTLILNGIQPVLSGVAVGCGWQTFVAKVNVGCYYIIGIPIGTVFGFYFEYDAKAIYFSCFYFAFE
ncbi:hypothetical protein F2Q69_00037590 [Brassica cretica]|uniref:Uncharacterized protein n=1 Tax=Brassica cretica TaxID=69181 RepID=A0A8S9SSE1_BRACR|nr:hypothetical protein F2Q69_00037590 [Brassica cretica]